MISGGRVEVGVGAGCYEHEWRAYGYGFPDTGTEATYDRSGLDLFARQVAPAPATA